MQPNDKKDRKDELTDLIQLVINEPVPKEKPAQIVGSDGEPVTLSLKPKKDRK